MKSIFAVFVFALSSAASAQEYRERQARAAEQAYEGVQAGVSGQAASARRSAETAKIRSSALNAALVAMNDGPEAGGRVIAFLNDRKIEVAFATQSEAVTTGLVNGRAAILLSDALPAHPRVYAPLIAAEAAKEMYAGMPACAERAYMRSATAARVFAELGGERKALPVVDGDKAEAVAAAVAAWTTDAQTALYKLGQAGGLDDIPDLTYAAKDPAKISALEAADRSFVSFLNDEREARAAF